MRIIRLFAVLCAITELICGVAGKPIRSNCMHSISSRSKRFAIIGKAHVWPLDIMPLSIGIQRDTFPTNESVITYSKVERMTMECAQVICYYEIIKCLAIFTFEVLLGTFDGSL